mmetsp:Transcript_86579/g.224879  ORF Transcript_86579/g.224879 Transcript_86579/m.224879 type:complete len:201 (-) Transcript_86579:179-781(-)
MLHVRCLHLLSLRVEEGGERVEMRCALEFLPWNNRACALELLPSNHRVQMASRHSRQSTLPPNCWSRVPHSSPPSSGRHRLLRRCDHRRALDLAHGLRGLRRRVLEIRLRTRVATRLGRRPRTRAPAAAAMAVTAGRRHRLPRASSADLGQHLTVEEVLERLLMLLCRNPRLRRNHPLFLRKWHQRRGSDPQQRLHLRNH